MHKTITGLLLILSLGACASLERFQRDMDGYLGWEIERLREHFGYNYVEHDLGDGTRAFTWVWSERSLRPGYMAPDVIHTYRSAEGATQVLVSPGFYLPPDYSEYFCEFSFIVDKEGRAVDWRAQGNGCASYPGPEYVLHHGGVPPDPKAVQQ